MGVEIDLLVNYPRPDRDVAARAAAKTEEDRAIARRFDREFFDGDRRTGYGGFSYNPRFWQPTVPVFQRHFGLTGDSSILDVGCAKGFMMHDFAELIPGITVKGIDVSTYAVENAIPSMRSHVQVADARALPFADRSFDVVISINTIHNLEIDGVKQALQEIQRVQRRGAFITVDAWRDAAEKERMDAWNLTAKTILSVSGWQALFAEVGYTGDYFWFIP
ncbi:MAG: class I SAM-dependent methyltransferase [Planctomycetes bacterium]|nr:class I SAM-dependent methyltransferase [Planctomycetota bacterium]